MTRAGLVAGAAVAALAGSACADVITDWNMMYREAIRHEPVGPGGIARSGAMMHVAMFNAVNAVGGNFNSYGGFNLQVGNASREAAAAVAAHRILTATYSPALHGLFDTQLQDSLSKIADGAAKMNGIALGEQAAEHMLALRSGDGSDVVPIYTPGGNVGDWVPTQAGDPVDPHWGNVTPWGMTSGDQFRSTRLTDYGTMENFMASQEWADNVNDVKENGRFDRWTPADEEYQIAFFWANDRNGTYKPPGHLNSITQTFADQAFAGLSAEERLTQNARLYALLNMALADAGVAAWDTKYNTDFDLCRPITAIQNAHLDGNDQTVQDIDWQPLNNVDPDGDGPLEADPFTPQFPSYASGHATFAAAHAAIMAAFFGSDTFDPMWFGTEDPYVEGLLRQFDSWSEMALENGRSRVYLGVHYQFDAEDGYTMGTSLADWIFANYLTQIPAPGSLAVLAMGALVTNRRRRG